MPKLMKGHNMTKTECYKCQTEIEVEDIEQVHPLCDDCDTDFMAWFASQLGN